MLKVSVCFRIFHFAASNAQMMKILNQAMEQWTSKTCIRFQQRTKEHGYAYFHFGQGYDVTIYPIKWLIGHLDVRLWILRMAWEYCPGLHWGVRWKYQKMPFTNFLTGIYFRYEELCWTAWLNKEPFMLLFRVNDVEMAFKRAWLLYFQTDICDSRIKLAINNP